MMFDRYEHRFTVSAIRTPAGISWSIEESDPELTIWDKEKECWVDMGIGMTYEDDSEMTRYLKQRLHIPL